MREIVSNLPNECYYLIILNYISFIYLLFNLQWMYVLLQQLTAQKMGSVYQVQILAEFAVFTFLCISDQSL